ncbi:MAG: MBL fold metallo-hydrolase [Candidatus Omnitrophica bacterium CG08_land_8_20_14_0_20_41_16]|uniref:MBL fold metallo-hydrolase n=1 Tax=Candidatus Sherwoodlollariibacterium unditelluris TaxID=1974757 RepID=A0A2G9YJQ4_9BACT|nr:MAG: MBL fold metallo-hydrolase [Candidatus Omnitrophica bacterium CG23_combo_of_CG06-09_8_20_14_all_41_10]PIS34310.1 MAG: MBL fold metallo-hydrolase [Candidatus Omnitrophica bacterium CG08_land_8_20_14_0_20_41_16]
MILETVLVGPMGVNCYVLASKEGSRAIIIDPGDEGRKIRQVLDRHNLEPGFIINTHGHYDHIGADNKFDVAVYVHKLDAPLLKEPMLNLSGLFSLPYVVKSKIKFLEDGEIITLDDIRLRVIHTPGHTPGGITLLLEKPVDKIAFTGDTLFCSGMGRFDLAGGNEKLLIKSIRERLFTLPLETRIYPGHGPASTIGEEKKNPAPL